MEMSEDIYENDKIYIIEKTVKTPTTRNIQHPPNSGFIAAGSWWFKLALVCQGLLCVFLLIVIIVLGVYINPAAERDQLKMNYFNLTVAIDQLQMNYINLTAERDQLRNENTEFPKQLAVLQQGCTYFNSSVYSIITERKNWSSSRQDCIQRGADLVIITSKEEQKFIDGCFPDIYAWIGLNDIDSEGKWMWVDGTALLYPGFWANGEPSNYSGNKDCVLTGYTNTLNSWTNTYCTRIKFGICKTKIFD